MQAELTGTPAPDETSDAVLLLRTREGDTEAYGSLYLRHVAAARVLARQLARDPIEADELVAESFARVLGVLHRGGGPEAALRPYLLSTMRRLHVDRRVAEQKTEPTDDLTPHDQGEPFVDLPADELERSIVSSAFSSLPERWRLVLWHTEVEGLTPAQVAPLLGISANATAALAVRARAGLRDAYLSAHVTAASDPACREIGQSLGGYVRGTLSRRERVAVDAHLDSCARCSAAVLELSDTAATMRGVIGPLVLGAAVLAYREGLLALGPHAVPSFALLHAGGTAPGLTGAGTPGSGGVGGSGGSGGVGGAATAGRPTWQLVGAAGVAGAVVIAAAVAFALGGGSSPRTSAGGPSASPTSGQPSPTSAPESTPTPTPSSTSTAPFSTSTTSPSNPQVNPVANTAPSSTTSPAATLPPLQPPPSSRVTLVTVGDLVAGRDNVLELSSTNPNPTAVSQSVVLTLPSGMALSSATTAWRGATTASAAGFRAPARSTAAGPAAGACTRTTHGASCTLGVLGPGASTTIRIPVTVAPSFTAGRWSVTVTARAGSRTASVTVSREFRVTPGGVSTTWSGHGRYQVSAGGAALLSCQDDQTPVKGCAEAEARTSPGHQDDDDWTMVRINDAGSPWSTSSSSAISLPSGSSVVAAWLSWSGSGLDPQATLDRTATIAGPGGSRSTVTAKTWDLVDLPSSGHGYLATADVTALVKAQGGGSWTVGDIALADGQSGIYAGWSLTVVTTSATAPVRDVTVLSGPWAITGPGTTWSGSAPGLSGRSADITLVAWEGDADITGDALLVHGQPVAALDAPGVTDNVAASSALGAQRAVSFGVDVRRLHAPAGPGDQLSVRTDGDSWALGQLVVSAG